ncbi:MAG: ABC transporter permease subunit [Planctomycetota bacterium]
MLTFLLQRLLALLAGTLGVLVAGFVWLNVAALAEPPRTPAGQQTAHHFGLDQPALINTRYALTALDVEQLLDATDPSRRARDGLSPARWESRARRAAFRLQAFGRDACVPLIELLVAANADTVARARAIFRRWGALSSEAKLDAAIGNTPEIVLEYDPATRRTGMALDRIMREPSLMAALESPALRDLLPDRARMEASHDPLARIVLIDAADALHDPDVLAMLIRPDVRRDLFAYATARQRRRHRAEALARQWSATIGEFPRPDRAAWLAEVRMLGLVRQADVDNAEAMVRAGEVQSVEQMLVGPESRVSPRVDADVRRSLLTITSRQGEWQAAAAVGRWHQWLDAQETSLQRTPEQQCVMLTLDTRLATYLERVLPDPAHDRWLPDVGRTRDGRDVWHTVAMTAPISVVLFALALVLASVLALIAGTAWALTDGRGPAGKAIPAVAFLAGAVPVLVPAVLLVLGAGLIWPGHLSSGSATGATGAVDLERLTSLGVLVQAVRSVSLPVLVLAATIFPLLLATIIHGVRRVMGSTHVLAARARGLDDRLVVRRHAVRPAFIGMVASIGRLVPVLLASLALVEWVCGIDGAGRFALQSALDADVGAVLAIVLVAGAFTVVGQAATAIVAVALSPQRMESRVRPRAVRTANR